jgi:hypothetical protein
LLLVMVTSGQGVVKKTSEQQAHNLYDPDAVTDRGKRPMYADDRQSGTIYCTSRATSRSHGVVTATGIYNMRS